MIEENCSKTVVLSLTDYVGQFFQKKMRAVSFVRIILMTFYGVVKVFLNTRMRYLGVRRSAQRTSWTQWLKKRWWHQTSHGFKIFFELQTIQGTLNDKENCAGQINWNFWNNLWSLLKPWIWTIKSLKIRTNLQESFPENSQKECSMEAVEGILLGIYKKILSEAFFVWKYYHFFIKMDNCSAWKPKMDGVISIGV